MVSALAALVVLAASQGAETQKRPVVAPPVGPTATVADLTAWEGWKLGTPKGWSNYLAPFNAPLPALRPDDPTSTTLKVKVFVLARTESSPLGTERAAILKPGLDRLRAALRNVQSIVRATSGGRLDLSLNISVDEDAIDLTESAAAISGYLRPRINGGRFDAEDGVDRGPYAGVLVVVPGGVSNPGLVNATPVRMMDYYRGGGEFGGTTLEASLLDSVNALISDRLIEFGGKPNASQIAEADAAGWPNFQTLPTDVLAGLRPGVDVSLPVLNGIAGATWSRPATPTDPNAAQLPYDAPVAVYLEADPARGTVLRYREPGEERLGGLSLPTVEVPAGKNLAFWTKVSGREGLAMHFAHDDKVTETILGPIADESGAALPLDGAWHRVIVAVPAGTTAMHVGPALGQYGKARRDVQFLNAWFDDFEWTDEAPTEIIDGPSRAAAARVETAPPADLPTLLVDPMPRVRAIALSRVAAGASDLEAIVTARAAEIDPAVSREAVKALGRIGTPTATAALRRILATGVTEASRQAAAYELAKTGDPTVITTLAILLGRQSWRSRLAAVESLGLFKQENAVRFRLSATLQDIPELRLAALRPATTANVDERQKLLYAAINDPSDEIRAFASDRLLDSPNESDVTEGGRAAADDSPWTRVLFQRNLAKRANPAFKPLVLKGLVDPVGLVRAEALRALAALGPIDASEAGNALNDPHPDVLLALIELSKGGKITLPDATKVLIAASVDARVVGARI